MSVLAKGGVLRRWRALWLILAAAPALAAPYDYTIAIASERHGLPHGMLERLLHAESSMRVNVVSDAGAVGIAQILPQYHPGVDPRDPHASIHYAARYLARLRNRFGCWGLALAAYNWGPTNVARSDYLPASVRAYVERIQPGALEQC